MDRIAELEARVERMGDMNAVLAVGLAAAMAQLRESRSICTMNWRFDVEEWMRGMSHGSAERRAECLDTVAKLVSDITASHQPAGH